MQAFARVTSAYGAPAVPRAPQIVRWARRGLVALALLLTYTASAADYYRTADGMAVYFGVLPAELVLGHSPEHPEKKMHGGVPRGKAQHHIVVAVFDTQNGERLSNVEVSARVQEAAFAPLSKKLEPMTIDKTTSFGNYFPMSGPGPYRIDVDIRKPGAARPVTVRFDYSHPRRQGRGTR